MTAALSEAAGNFGRQTEAAREELARRIAWRAAAPARTKEAPADQKCQKEQERLAQLSEEQFAQAAKETEKQLASEEKRQKTRREEYAAYEKQQQHGTEAAGKQKQMMQKNRQRLAGWKEKNRRFLYSWNRK